MCYDLICRSDSGQIEYADFVDIMTQKMADRDPEEEIKKAFNLFDDDGSGVISIKNLRRVARELVCVYTYLIFVFLSYIYTTSTIGCSSHIQCSCH